MARIWDAFLTDRDKKIFGAAGYGREAEFKGRPALLIIDVNFGFVGDRPEEILDSILKFPNSCGADGWQAMERLVPVLEAARGKCFPILFTTGDVLAEVRLVQDVLNVLPGHQLVVLILPVVFLILSNKHTLWKGCAQAGADHVDAVRVCDLVDTVFCHDLKGGNVCVTFFPTIHNECIAALAGGNEVTRAIFSVVKGQPLDIWREMTSPAGRVHQSADDPTVWFGLVLPNADVFFADIKMSELIIRHATLGLGTDVETSHNPASDDAIPIVEELPLLHFTLLGIDKEIVLSGKRAAVHAEAVSRDLGLKSVSSHLLKCTGGRINTINDDRVVGSVTGRDQRDGPACQRKVVTNIDVHDSTLWQELDLSAGEIINAQSTLLVRPDDGAL